MNKIISFLILLTSITFAQHSSTMMLLMGDDKPQAEFTVTCTSTGNIILKGTGVITVDWGDNSTTNYTLTTSDQNIAHTYSVAGTYKIKISKPELITSITMTTLAGATYTIRSADLHTPNLTSLTLRSITGTQTINSSDLPNLTYLYLRSISGTLSGNISSFKSTMTTLYTNKSGFDITTGTMPAWAGNTITIIPTTEGYTTAQIDAFLISWASTAGAGTKTIDLRGANQPRSSASDAAVATLNALGKTILTNP